MMMQSKRSWVWVALGLVGASFSASACKSRSSPAPAASASAEPKPLPPNVDADLYRELQRIASTCKVDDRQAMVMCPGGDHRKLMNEFSSNTRSRAAAVPSFAAALRDTTPGVQTVAANILFGAFRSSWGDVQPGSVDPKAAEDLLSATLTLPKSQSRQALPAAINAAMLANRSDLVFSTIGKMDDVPLRAVAVRYLMTHGRLAAFPKVQEFAKDSNPSVALAAVESPQYMFNWTADEQKAICPWVADLLSDKRPAIAGKSATLVGNCGGEFVDKLLDSREQALKSGEFSTAELNGIRDLCAPARLKRKETAPTEAQCKRNRKLLEKVIDTKTISEPTRNSALTALAYQFPDDDTLKLVKRLEKTEKGVLMETARRTIQRIEARDKPGAIGNGKPPLPMIRPNGAPAAAPPRPASPPAAPAAPAAPAH